jgi:hypothetical protein
MCVCVCVSHYLTISHLSGYRSIDPFIPSPSSSSLSTSDLSHLFFLFSLSLFSLISTCSYSCLWNFYQDDLYPPARDFTKCPATIGQWQQPAFQPDIATVSMCPVGMGNLSTAPAVEKSKKPSSAYFLAQVSANLAPSTPFPTHRFFACTFNE